MTEKEAIPSEVRSKARWHTPLRGALRWALVALVAFGLGAILIALALNVPTRQKLGQANSDLEHARVTMSSQPDQIATLQTSNETLQENLDSATVHSYLLKTVSAVRGASLAVTADDYAGARLSLVQASAALDTLATLPGVNQKDVLTAMQKSVAQALADMQSNLGSAQPELDQLTKNLVQLEANLFPNP